MAANAQEGLFSCTDLPTLCALADFVGKNPLWGMVGVLAIVAALFYLGMRLSTRAARRDKERFARFVASQGGIVDPGKALRGHVEVNGHEARIETWVPLNSTRNRVMTGYEMAVADAGMTLDIRPRDAAVMTGESLAFDDPAFDAGVWVVASDAGRARALLTPALRARIAAVAELSRTARHPYAWHLHKGHLRFETPGAFGGADFDARFREALRVGAMMVAAMQTA